MNKARRGIYAAAVSPFDQSGRLDCAKLIEYCKYLLGPGGCDGVAPTGTTGEGTSISVDERIVLQAEFAKAGIPADRVIFGTGNPAVGDAVRLSKNSVECGYPNVLLLPPYYYKSVSDDGLFAYFARIVEGVGDARLRIYLYHFPQMSQTPISLDLISRLRTEFGSVIAGLKDSSGDFEYSRKVAEHTGGVAEDFDIFPSSEAMYFDAISAGCAGIISGSTNVFAPLVQQAIAAGAAQSVAFQNVCAARKFAAGFNLMAAMKSAEAHRSGDSSWLRMAPPLSGLTDAQRSEFIGGLDGFLKGTSATV